MNGLWLLGVKSQPGGAVEPVSQLGGDKRTRVKQRVSSSLVADDFTAIQHFPLEEQQQLLVQEEERVKVSVDLLQQLTAFF